ncbi:LysM peptidoglycan-binding domain-containing protein, partial [Parabacteroides sp.]
NLYTIANRYGVTAKDIRKWNGLGSNRVAKGKRLKLYVDNGGVAFASASAPTKTTAKPAAKSSIQKGFVSYKVQSGDSLYSISKKYPGVSTAALQKANGLSSPDIRPGQVLKIPVG